MLLLDGRRGQIFACRIDLNLNEESNVVDTVVEGDAENVVELIINPLLLRQKNS